MLTALSPTEQGHQDPARRIDLTLLGAEREAAQVFERPAFGFLCSSACRDRARRRRPASWRNGFPKNGHRPIAGFRGRLPSGCTRAVALSWPDRSTSRSIRVGITTGPWSWPQRSGSRRRSRAATFVLVDTAGRLHIDDELMVELEQLRDKLKPTEVLFVADAMTGQDAVKSAARFHERYGVERRDPDEDGR